MFKINQLQREGFSSLLIIDDCVNELIQGDIPILKLMTNGRSIGLTVISLWQSNVRAGTVGNAIRENQATVIFFRNMIDTVSNDWMKNDKDFKRRADKQVTGQTAGVLEMDLDRKMYVMQAPKEYPMAILGRPDWRDELAGITSSQTKVRFYDYFLFHCIVSYHIELSNLHTGQT